MRNPALNRSVNAALYARQSHGCPTPTPIPAETHVLCQGVEFVAATNLVCTYLARHLLDPICTDAPTGLPCKYVTVACTLQPKVPRHPNAITPTVLTQAMQTMHNIMSFLEASTQRRATRTQNVASGDLVWARPFVTHQGSVLAEPDMRRRLHNACPQTAAPLSCGIGGQCALRPSLWLNALPTVAAASKPTVTSCLVATPAFGTLTRNTVLP